MNRRLLNVLTVLSLLLCAAVVAVWVRSYWVGDVLTWARVDVDESGALVRYRSTLLVSGRGGIGLLSRMQRYEGERDVNSIALIRQRAGIHWVTGPRPPTYAYRPIERGTLWQALGFDRHNYREYSGVEIPLENGQYSFPAWLPAALFAMLPALSQQSRAALVGRTFGFRVRDPKGNFRSNIVWLDSAYAGPVDPEWIRQAVAHSNG